MKGILPFDPPQSDDPRGDFENLQQMITAMTDDRAEATAAF
jgi:hypothetical protein